MKIVSLFNNKGGVGKTTLAYHLSHILADKGYRVLMIDLDPQCNLTIMGLEQEHLHQIWCEEDPFIDDYKSARDSMSLEQFQTFCSKNHTIHFLLKPIEDGADDFVVFPAPIELAQNLALIPGRLTINQYEQKIAERWSHVYSGEPLAISTVIRIRKLAEQYASQLNYDFVIIDTSPSLGVLNKIIISTVDGFIIPALPDMFSLYGIRNIGNSLATWKKEFDIIYQLIPDKKRQLFPSRFVTFLGYTIYNAKRYSDNTQWNLAQAHLNYALQIPTTIKQFISEDVRSCLTEEMVQDPIGGTAVMHTHNTLPNMAQKYKHPIWEIPTLTLEEEDKTTIMGNQQRYYSTKEAYSHFADDFINRLKLLDKL